MKIGTHGGSIKYLQHSFIFSNWKTIFKDAKAEKNLKCTKIVNIESQINFEVTKHFQSNLNVSSRENSFYRFQNNLKNDKT